MVQGTNRRPFSEGFSARPLSTGEDHNHDGIYCIHDCSRCHHLPDEVRQKLAGGQVQAMVDNGSGEPCQPPGPRSVSADSSTPTQAGPAASALPPRGLQGQPRDATHPALTEDFKSFKSFY